MGNLRTAAACELDQSTETVRISALVAISVEDDVRQIPKTMASKSDEPLFGPGAAELRNNTDSYSNSRDSWVGGTSLGVVVFAGGGASTSV